MKKYIITDYNVKPDVDYLQTAEIQKVLDMCRGEGGMVVIPKGSFRISGVRMWSDTTLYLESGANLIGSEECEDYAVFEVPDNIKLYTDQEAFLPFTSNGKTRDEYRRAMISAYGEENIKIIGEEDSVIDGKDCFDPNGEEDFRGPHGIFMSNCKNVVLKGYIIKNSGNFMHQLDKCTNVEMSNVTALAGHDGIHLHCCENFMIDSCKFHTGDDCIAGANVKNLTVTNCDLNTSCNFFRIGGINIDVNNTVMNGPGYYPHRMTVVKGKNNYLSREEGRHNTLCVMDYFASANFDTSSTAHNIIFRNCKITNVDKLIGYDKDNMVSQGMYLESVLFENLEITGLNGPSVIRAEKDHPVSLFFKNVNLSFRENAKSETLYDVENTNIINIK